MATVFGWAGMLNIALGTIAGSYTLYLNGNKLNMAAVDAKANATNIASSSPHSDSSSGGLTCGSYLQYHRISVQPSQLSTKANVIAVRVVNGDGNLPGGLYDSMAGDQRSGAFDPGASPGQKQTGYTLAGTYHTNTMPL